MTEHRLAKVYSFHWTLSNSREPFRRLSPSQDLASFWGFRVRTFHHFGVVPGENLRDRAKTVVKPRDRTWRCPCTSRHSTSQRTKASRSRWLPRTERPHCRLVTRYAAALPEAR